MVFGGDPRVAARLASAIVPHSNSISFQTTSRALKAYLSLLLLPVAATFREILVYSFCIEPCTATEVKLVKYSISKLQLVVAGLWRGEPYQRHAKRRFLLLVLVLATPQTPQRLSGHWQVHSPVFKHESPSMRC